MKGRKKLVTSLVLIGLVVLASYILQARLSNTGAEKLDQPLGQEKELLGEAPVQEELVKEDIRKINILAAGDIMYHMPQVRGGYDSASGSYNYDENFKHIKGYLDRSDLAIANFETVAGGKDLGYSGYPSFNSPVETLDAIKKVGFDILNYSNNHVLDRGKDGLLKTVDNIRAREMDTIGAGLGDKKLIKEVDGIKLGFLSYSYGFNGREAAFSREDLASFVNIIDEDRIRADIKSLKEEKVDFIISYIHWGDEYSLEPNQGQMELANMILDQGGDIILGSHPHVIQRSVLQKDYNTYVVYSLGNFISNQRLETLKNPNTEDGLMVSIDLAKDMVTGRKEILAVENIPTWTYKYPRGNKSSYEIIPIKDALEGRIDVYNLEAIRGRLENSLRRTNQRLNDV